MAPLAATLTNAAFELIARQLGGANRTPQQTATEGRFSYVPSFGASVLFSILFAVVTLANVFLFFRHRSWFWWSMNLAVVSQSPPLTHILHIQLLTLLSGTNRLRGP
jgi:hypothetical protein